MDTGLKDKNGTTIEVGSQIKLELENGEVRIFDVCLKTVKRIIKSHPNFDEEFAKVNITGIVFSWNGYDLFPCIDENGIPDNEKMELILKSDINCKRCVFRGATCQAPKACLIGTSGAYLGYRHTPGPKYLE